MIIYAETTTDFTRTTTEIQTTPFLHPGPNVTIGEHRRNIYMRVFKNNDNENKKLKKNRKGYRKLNHRGINST